MFYATYDLVGITDILAFNTRAARDEWVKYLDAFSLAVNETPENCVFERKALDTPKELLFAETMMHKCELFTTKESYTYNPLLTVIDKHKPLIVKDVCLPDAVIYLSSCLDMIVDNRRISPITEYDT